MRRDSKREGGGMDFVTVVDQVIILLRQRGRVAYRTLKRQFQLDDEALEDLKIARIDSQRLATDEQGIVLVWSGTAAAWRVTTGCPAAQEATTLPSVVPPGPRGSGAWPTPCWQGNPTGAARASSRSVHDSRKEAHNGRGFVITGCKFWRSLSPLEVAGEN